MSQTAVQRLYLMQVGSMPDYQIPIVCYLVQTADGQHMLIDSGLPEMIPDQAAEFANGQDVIAQLARIGLQPDDIETVISTHYGSRVVVEQGIGISSTVHRCRCIEQSC